MEKFTLIENGLPCTNGDKVRDKITGFEGVVICISFWLNGCVQINVLSAERDKDGKEVSDWFDQGRIELIKEGVISVDDDENGGPQSSQPSPRKVY